MKYIIFDLETTCWDQEDQSDSETIEIGAVMINENQEIIKEFDQFVKPIRYPKLSKFCTSLTSIKQEDIDSAPYFYTAKEKLLEWIEGEEYILCSWGEYDKKQLERDCEIHFVDATWALKHINLKQQYGEFKNMKKAVGMKSALENEKIALIGMHHRGIDDARNISKIFIKYFDKWDFTKISK